MRLSDRLVIQQIERADGITPGLVPGRNEYVLVDDEHGTEIVLTANEVGRLAYAIRYFAGYDQALTTAIVDAANVQPWSGR